MNRRVFDRMASRMANRIQMMVARAVVTLVNDAGGIQALQLSVLDGELAEAAERMQDYGFTSVPHPGAEAVMVFPGGLRSHGLVVALGDRRYRLKALQQGEAALYDDLGQVVHLTRDGMVIRSPLKIEIEAPEVTITATQTATIAAPTILLDGEVELGGTGGKAIARHDDPVVAGKVVATSVRVSAT